MSDFSTLPNEVWRMILSQLKNPIDKENAAKCLCYFRVILLEERVHFLFPKIVKILVSKKELTKPDDTIVPLVTQTDILRCRLITSKWNIAVEECYQELEVSGFYPFLEDRKTKKQIGIRNPNEWSNPYIFSVLQSLRARQFLTEFIEVQRNVFKNPFLGRFVVISFGSHHNRVDTEQFLMSLSRILATFGEEIWYANVYIKCSPYYNATEDYMRLRNWLRYMPNLKSLRLQFHCHGVVAQEVLDSSPLPLLNNLIYLKVSNVSVNVLNELLTKYYQMVYLYIDDCGPVVGWTFKVFPNLQGLYINAHRTVCSQVIEWVGNETKLRTLFVYNHEVKLKFARQFQLMNKYWSESLKDLTLMVEDFRSEMDTNELNLKLPNLKNLKLFSYGTMCIDFALPLRNLETLDVSLFTDDSVIVENFRTYEQKGLPRQKILFVGFENRMQHSNIWSLLSKLSLLKIKFTRRCPVLCYEFAKEKSGNVMCSSYFQNQTKNVRLPYTNELVFSSFQY